MGIVTLLLTEKQISTLIEEARRKHPVEACGLLFGHITEREMFIKRIVPTRNLLESPTRFRISPEEFVRHLFKAEGEGLRLIGFFHSHPADPAPSSIDYSVAAYLVDDGKLVKIRIKTPNENVNHHCGETSSEGDGKRNLNALP